jgi:class 3 adenylate cyclase
MTSMADPVAVQLGSVLFTDLVGFTEFTDAAGDAAALRVLDAQTSMVSSILDDEPDSRVVKELGDGLMVWMAHPVSAVDVACRLLDGFRQAQSDDRIPLAVRMGMHFGEAIVRGEDFIGQTVNIASRVSDLAGPGELLVSEGVVTAARGSLVSRSFEPVGPTQVKGVQAPVWLYRLAD